MDILIVHEVFYPNFVGGGEVIIFNLIKQMEKLGHNIALATSGIGTPKKYKGITITYICKNRFLLNLHFFKIAKLSKNFDFILCTTYNAAIPSFIASLISKKPVSLIVLGSYGNKWLKIRGKLKGLIFMLIERIIFLLPYKHLFALSNFSKEKLIKMGIKKSNISVSNPGMDWKSNKINFKIKKNQVLFASRIDEQKGIKYLLKAASDNPGVKFIVAGTGRLDNFLKRNAPNNLEILGFIDRNKLKSYYRDSLIFCLPSEGETFGLAILEAMHYGCAIVSTVPLDYEGIHLVKPDDLSIGIKKLINNPTLAKKYGKRNVVLSRKYTWETFARNIEKELYY